MTIEYVLIGTMAVTIAALLWVLIGKQAEVDTYRSKLYLAKREAGEEYSAAQRGFKAREREIAILNERVAKLEQREIQQAKLRSEHENAFDQIFANAQKYARPF